MTGKPFGKSYDENSKLYSLCYSPDDKIIVSGGTDKVLYMWDANTRKLIREPLVGHTDTIMCVTYSPDGSKILSSGGSRDGTIRIWDAKTGKQIGNPINYGEGRYGYGLYAESLCYSPDGTRFVTGGVDSTIHIWDAKTRKPLIEPIREHIYGISSSVSDVKYSPDGTKIVSAGGERANAIYQWDANSGKLIGEPFLGRTGVAYSVSYNPDGSSIVCGFSDGTVCILDSNTLEILSGPPIRVQDTAVWSISHNKDGTRFVCGDQEGNICQWDSKRYFQNDGCEYCYEYSDKWELCDWGPNDWKPNNKQEYIWN